MGDCNRSGFLVEWATNVRVIAVEGDGNTEVGVGEILFLSPRNFGDYLSA